MEAQHRPERRLLLEDASVQITKRRHAGELPRGDCTPHRQGPVQRSRQDQFHLGRHERQNYPERSSGSSDFHRQHQDDTSDARGSVSVLYRTLFVEIPPSPPREIA